MQPLDQQQESRRSNYALQPQCGSNMRLQKCQGTMTLAAVTGHSRLGLKSTKKILGVFAMASFWLPPTARFP